MFFPNLYQPGHTRDSGLQLTNNELADIYNIAIYPAAYEAAPHKDTHRPTRYESELGRTFAGKKWDFRTFDIGHRDLERFGRLVLRKLQAIPWAKDAFYFVDIQNRKGATSHPVARDHDRNDDEHSTWVWEAAEAA